MSHHLSGAFVPYRLLVRCLLALCMALCMALCFAAATARAAAAPVILVLGDSISAGYGLPRGHRLDDAAAAAPRRGALSASRRQRQHQRRHDRRRPRAARRAARQVSSGRHRDRAGRQRRTARRQSRRHARQSRRDDSRGAKGGIARADRRHAPAAELRASRTCIASQATFARCRRARKAALVPFLFEGFAEDNAMFQPDRIHPVAAAQAKMLDNVWPQLQAVARRRGKIPVSDRVTRSRRRVGVDALAALSGAHRRAQPRRVCARSPSGRDRTTRCSTTRSARASGRCTRASPFEARRLGAAMVARNIAAMLETAFADKPRDWQPLVYCWRGGQRSRALAHILNEVGWRAMQLDGGYRAYRRHVVTQLEALPARFDFVVICGLTGSRQEPAPRRARREGRADARSRRPRAPSRIVAGRISRRRAAFAEELRERYRSTRSPGSTRPRAVFVESESQAHRQAAGARGAARTDAPGTQRHARHAARRSACALLKEEYGSHSRRSGRADASACCR